MSRIRSIHPGLFTDEAFMTASPMARLLILGLWTEAWDDGVFEWKPLTLKARLFPVDNCDVGALLSELEGLNMIKGYSHGGKPYGAIRNFQKYQRPKKPNSSKALPNDLRSYVGQSSTSTEPVPNQSAISVEKSQQREEGGWRMEDGKEEPILQAQQPTIPAAAPADLKIDFEEVRRRCEQAAGREFPHFQTIITLVDQGVDLERRILPIIRDVIEACRRNGRDPPTSWRYFEAPIMDHERPIKGVLPSKPAAGVEFIEEGTPEYEALMAGPKGAFFRSVATHHPETGKAGVYRKREAA